FTKLQPLRKSLITTVFLIQFRQTVGVKWFAGKTSDKVKPYIDGILSDKKIYFIDLFCGAGGVSTGISMARKPDGSRAAKVLACVNHDPLAILSHEANHPDVLHYTEDIRTLDLNDLIALVRSKRVT